MPDLGGGLIFPAWDEPREHDCDRDGHRMEYQGAGLWACAECDAEHWEEEAA